MNTIFKHYWIYCSIKNCIKDKSRKFKVKYLPLHDNIIMKLKIMKRENTLNYNTQVAFLNQQITVNFTIRIIFLKFTLQILIAVF